ncbi:MAG: bifunctional 4-hydroxy-2-oxoglutarate aldolase/2-dehydro-3-deoxy-phosphogluconate aldolase [Candidatus Limnocylindrales bacterium]
MARYSRLEVLSAALEQRVLPIFNTADAATAVDVVDACAAAGARVIEYTNRGAGAYEVYRALTAHVAAARPEVMLGAGTILDAATAALFIAADADFIVAPTLSPDVARLCNRRAVPYLPGCFSATEVSDAQELGCELIKVFPQAAVDGPAWLRSVLGPLPWSRLVPTGCPSDADTLRAWFAAGAAGVGVGPDIFTAERLSARDTAGMTTALRAALDVAREAPRR